MWSIRGGFGRAFDLTYGNLNANAAPAYFQTTQDVDLSTGTPNFLENGGLTGRGGGLPTDVLGLRGVQASYTFGGQRPYGLTWNLGVERASARAIPSKCAIWEPKAYTCRIRRA